jgi:PD-(D/E)XK nuclease superfamily
MLAIILAGALAMITPTLSPNFLADLKQVSEAAGEQPPISAAFLFDLKQVHSTLPLPNDARLHDLAERFRVWRSRVQCEVHDAIVQLPADDPLCCPISLFGTMDYGRLETAHTNALAWLLDPNKPHGFGDTLLRAVLAWHPDGGDAKPLRNTRVSKEHSIFDVGRLDILAEGSWNNDDTPGSWVLVIEAKIDSSEGESQLAKYDKWLAKYARGRQLLRVLLTANGILPEDGSDDWKPLSFLELVQILRKPFASLRDTAGFSFLRLYLAGVLQDICGFPAMHAENSADPYSLASYLKTVDESSTKGTHDTAR